MNYMKLKTVFVTVSITLLVTSLSLFAVSAVFAEGESLSLSARKYDINDDNEVDIKDVSTLLNYLADSTEPETGETYTEPTIVVGKAAAYAGQSGIEVPVTLKNNPGVSSVAFDVAYGEGLTLTAITFNMGSFPGSTVTSQTLDSPAFVSWVNYTTEVEGDAVFVTLVFDVSAQAQGTIAISVSYDEDNIYDIDENNICFDTAEGGVTITG